MKDVEEMMTGKLTTEFKKDQVVEQEESNLLLLILRLFLQNQSILSLHFSLFVKFPVTFSFCILLGMIFIITIMQAFCFEKYNHKFYLWSIEITKIKMWE